MPERSFEENTVFRVSVHYSCLSAVWDLPPVGCSFTISREAMHKSRDYFTGRAVGSSFDIRSF